MAKPTTPAGYTSTIDLFGDSLTAGSGGSGRNVETVLRALLPGRIINNWGIPGQTAEQIAARQGGLPLTLTVTGGALPASFATAAVTPSTQLLSTPADNTTRYLSGSISGAPATLVRTATGGPPSTSETYTIMNAGNPNAVTVAGWAPFVPDQATNAADSVQVLWLGRNNVPSLANVPTLVNGCIQAIPQPRRVIVIGILPSLEETNGTSSKTAIDSANASIKTLTEAAGGVFIPSTPPTTAEMTALGYTPTTQDNTDIANGVFPTGMRSDTAAPHVHLEGVGYSVFAYRLRDAINDNGF